MNSTPSPHKVGTDGADTPMTPEERRRFLLAPIALPIVHGRQNWGGVTVETRSTNGWTSRKPQAYTSSEDNR